MTMPPADDDAACADVANGREQARRAIAFVDLAGTALTDAHGDAQAADTQQAFVTALREALGDSVECVKHLGDGALLAARDGADMLRALTALTRDWSTNPHAPLVRARCARRAGLTSHPLGPRRLRDR